jgi:hypothetical protein
VRVVLLLSLSCLSVTSKLLAPSRGMNSQTQQHQSNSTKKPTNSNQQGTENTPLIVRVVPTPKTQEETAQETKDRAEKSANDRKLVNFSGALVNATYVLAAIGVLQLIVFGYQAYQLRRTVKAATDQSGAMERSITEAGRAAKAMEDVARHFEANVSIVRERTAQQMRAYLTVLVGLAVYQEREKGTRFEGKPLLVNSGPTPARAVKYRARADILPIPLPEDFNFPLPEKHVEGGIMGPHQNANMSAIVENFIEDGEVENAKLNKGKALYVWGIVTYADIFGEPHYTKFCQSLFFLPDGKIWGTYTPNYNDGD